MYNPTSILWRYAAIADRRIRARCWDKKVFAATNALFWTSQGWDGSEEMVALSSPYCTHLPEHARIAVFSREFVKTSIVTLQGTQAVVALGLALGDKPASDGFVVLMGVDQIFFPLAFIGLLRLFCAFWLTDDFAYTSLGSATRVEDAPSTAKMDNTSRVSMDSLLGYGVAKSDLKDARFLPTSSWGSRAFRALFIILLLGLWVICVLFLLQPKGGKVFTTTAFLVALFYLVFISASVVICGYYLARGHTSTAIPCAGSLWYASYTGLLIAMTLVVFVVACVETRRTACGRWTSAPYSVGDYWACSDSRMPDVVAVDPSSRPAFGLATIEPSYDQHNETLGYGEFWVRNFTGHCLGFLGNTTVKLASTREVVDLRDFEGGDANSYSLWY